ncbi:hypothetical protein [Halarcobacter bivalviorum]|uniref:DUF945 domain-containing protein n=1 Tax=Halarcobacter bivalviorum TaxID=663364 RepID=A0AAX2ADS5_9BACT|nr:hypothetical protein [Halarcobacter bivalviorum]AXH12183.1 hypothetical protein ABIV_1181 [Halarcobacter bivalviorum]RXK11288.1 hypothetical protein CRV05_02670 [Halarcobacter bivalviorum]
MKNGIVLLVTLFFIIALSVLVIKNLDDTDKYLQKNEYISNSNQLLINIKNTQIEVSKLLKTKSSSFEDDDLNVSLPLVSKDLKISFYLRKYDKVDINSINIKDNNELHNLFENYNVYNYDYFVDIYKQILNEKKISKITSSAQLDYVIDKFKIKTEDIQIKTINDMIGFLENKDLFELNIDAKYFDTKLKAYYILSKTGEVKYFDISFI